MGVNKEEDINTSMLKFPFAMVISSILLKGAMFFLLNGPLLTLVLKQASFSNIYTLFHNGFLEVIRTFLNLHSNNGILSLSLFLFGSLIIGFLLSPFERITCVVVPLVVCGIQQIMHSTLLKYLLRKSPRRYFTPLDFRANDEVDIEEWLLKNPVEKSYWEWGLFLYNSCWSMFFNISIFSGLSLFLLRSSLGIGVFIIYIFLILVYLVFALDRSSAMATVHEYYRNKVSLKKG